MLFIALTKHLKVKSVLFEVNTIHVKIININVCKLKVEVNLKNVKIYL